MTVGTEITGGLNSAPCGRVVFPSGYKCCTDEFTAKENAFFAFDSGVGFDRSGRSNKVTCDSWRPSNSRTRRETIYARESTTSELMSFTTPSWSIALRVRPFLVSIWVMAYDFPSVLSSIMCGNSLLGIMYLQNQRRCTRIDFQWKFRCKGGLLHQKLAERASNSKD